MLINALYLYNKMYQTATKSKKKTNTYTIKSNGNYVYKPYRTLNNY